MNEFMLLIRNEIDHQATWSPEQHKRFLKSCEHYIGKLKREGIPGSNISVERDASRHRRMRPSLSR